MTPFTLTLYGTLGCHLCDEAQVRMTPLIDAYPLTLKLVDIIDLPEAQMQQMATAIPVLKVASILGVQHFYWPFSLMDVSAYLNTYLNIHLNAN